MAPTPDSTYFPSLDKCLQGGRHLISWENAFFAILNKDSTDAIDIDNFFADQDVHTFLLAPFEAFSLSSSSTKSAFETRTSAINVAPSPKARFDIKEIKEDALWLSSEAKIDEISALRVVILECQSREAIALLGPLSTQELRNIQDVGGHGSTFLPLATISQSADAQDIHTEFMKQDSRRVRLLRIYLSERRFFLKCVSYLLQNNIYLPDGNSGDEALPNSNSALNSMEKLGRALVVSFGKSENGLLSCIKSIGSNIEKLKNGSGWYKENGVRSEIEADWINTNIAEATTAMEIIYQLLDTAGSFPTSSAVLGWYEIAIATDFFAYTHDDLATQLLAIHMQSIAAIISFQILGVASCVPYLQTEPLKTSDEVSTAYISRLTTLEELSSHMKHLANAEIMTAGPSILGWSVILYTLLSRVQSRSGDQEEDGSYGTALAAESTQISAYRRTMDAIMNTETGTDVDFHEYLGRTAIDTLRSLDVLSEIGLRLGDKPDAHFSNVLGAKMRISILDLIESSSIIGVQYSVESASAILSNLTGGQSYWNSVDSRSNVVRKIVDPLAVFLSDESLCSSLIDSRARFPMEPLPFLEISRTLAACQSTYGVEGGRTVLDFLESIPTFTFTLPDKFSDYETTREEENTNSIRLLRPVELFQHRRMLPYRYQDPSLDMIKVDADFVIAPGTYGRIVSEDSTARVAYWFHEYSGLKYLGKLLETFIPAGDLIDATTSSPVDRETVTAIISLFAHLIYSVMKSPEVKDNKPEAMRILGVASSGLHRKRDLIALVFDIFELELQTRAGSSRSGIPLDVLDSCVQLMHALTLASPERVWPLLAKSSLLELGHGVGKLASVVGGAEMTSGRYSFLTSCARLYEGLVEDLVANALIRRVRSKNSRLVVDDSSATVVPHKIMSNVLLFFTRYFIGVLESTSAWKFGDMNDCRELRKFATKTFDKIIRYTYGIEDVATGSMMTSSLSSDQSSSQYTTSKTTTLSANLESSSSTTSLLAALEPAAVCITENFLSASTSTLRIQAILSTLYDGFEARSSGLFIHECQLCVEQVRAVLNFSQILLQAGALLQRPASELETQLFKISPLIARLYAVDEAYQIPVLGLLEALVTGASFNSPEPPSLLGHLGLQTAKSFLSVISALDQPIARKGTTFAITHFMTKVVGSRQQWFAQYLLTGKASRGPEHKSGSQGSDEPVKPPVAAALSMLARIKELPRKVALERLEFITASQNFWPWSAQETGKQSDFIKTISEFVGTLKPIQHSSSLADMVEAALLTKMLACIAEILAMYLFQKRVFGNSNQANELVPNLDYFMRFAIKSPKEMQYNTSLHGNLKRNFESRYVGCQILGLQKTALQTQEFGTDYFYDIKLADKMLHFDAAWGKPQGFRSEAEMANVNLSCVDAQIALLHGWKFLAIELSNNLVGETRLQSQLAQVAGDCMVANSQSQGPEELFQRLNRTRSDLALVLIQRLIQANSTVREMDGLLSKIWQAILQSSITFEIALEGGDATYYRSLLKLLFLSLRIHGGAKDEQLTSPADFKASSRMIQSQSVTGIVLEILDRVVAQGFREVNSFLHSKSGESTPQDIVLLTGILQSCLRVPGIEFCYSQIISIFETGKSAHLATSLFSWSDTLAVDGDPIYGELSILFLLELSTVPAMAEQIAIGGILGHISSANITTYLRNNAVGPFADGVGIQRCYSIWVRGILPLLLNLLHAVGAPIASEVSLFLAQFPALLNQSIAALDPPSSSRMALKTESKHITLSMCSEVHTLSLIVLILNEFRNSNAGLEIADVKWDVSGMFENAEFWVGSPNILRSKIVPMGPRDLALFKKKRSASSESNMLEDSIMAELIGVQSVLSGGSK